MARDRRKVAYKDHKHNAQKRGVEWQLTFDEWWQLWEDSGRWPERGQRADQYCMGRHGDRGPYSVHNVRIDTVQSNLEERWGHRVMVDGVWWPSISAAARGLGTSIYHIRRRCGLRTSWRR